MASFDVQERSAGSLSTPISPKSSGTALYPDALREELTVIRRVAKEHLARLGALEVEVGVVLPGEPDATVDLDVLGRREEIRLRARRPAQAGDHRHIRRTIG